MHLYRNGNPQTEGEETMADTWSAAEIAQFDAEIRESRKSMAAYRKTAEYKIARAREVFANAHDRKRGEENAILQDAIRVCRGKQSGNGR